MANSDRSIIGALRDRSEASYCGWNVGSGNEEVDRDNITANRRKQTLSRECGEVGRVVGVDIAELNLGSTGVGRTELEPGTRRGEFDTAGSWGEVRVEEVTREGVGC